MEALSCLRSHLLLTQKSPALEFIEQLVHNWDWEQVADGLGVQCAVVDAESPGAVFLGNKEDRRLERRGTWVYDAMPKHVGALALNFVFEQLRVTIRSYRNGRRVGEQVNAVVEAA